MPPQTHLAKGKDVKFSLDIPIYFIPTAMHDKRCAHWSAAGHYIGRAKNLFGIFCIVVWHPQKRPCFLWTAIDPI